MINKLFCMLFLTLAASAAPANPIVKLETDLGPITVELLEKEAPVTVRNFLEYVENGFYDGTIFHRVIPSFVIQGGGFTFDFVKKETRDPIINESDNGLLNKAGTLAMARTADPDSATSQFYINAVDNPNLDEAGYAVFGKVLEGWEVLDEIQQVPRGRYPGFPHAPNEMIRILKAAVTKDGGGE